MEKKVIKFIKVWKSNQNGWAYLTGGGKSLPQRGATPRNRTKDSDSK